MYNMEMACGSYRLQHGSSVVCLESHLVFVDLTTVQTSVDHAEALLATVVAVTLLLLVGVVKHGLNQIR